MSENGNTVRSFPHFAGIILGLAVGGLFDGIVLHQVLQWHHMLSSVVTPDTIENLKVNTFWDGAFHVMAWVLLAIGLVLFWRHARSRHAWWSSRLFAGTLLLGWGVFNLVEGIANHLLLGLHHVNETVPQTQWMAWDIGFLGWGTLMVLAGNWLIKQGKRRMAARRAGAPTGTPSPDQQPARARAS